MTATASANRPSFTIADWGVTEEKVMQAVERIIAVASPQSLVLYDRENDRSPNRDAARSLVV